MQIFGIKLVSVKEWERLVGEKKRLEDNPMFFVQTQPIRTKRKYVKSGKYSKKNK